MATALRVKLTSCSTCVFSQILVIFLTVRHLDDIFFMQPCEMLSKLTALMMKSFLGEKNKIW